MLTTRPTSLAFAALIVPVALLLLLTSVEMADAAKPSSNGPNRGTKIWDVTGLERMPALFYQSGLQKVRMVYMRELFSPEPPADIHQWHLYPPDDWSTPDVTAIAAAAARYSDESMVILDIEGQPLHEELRYWYYPDPETMPDALSRITVVLNVWRQVNPEQTVCLYGFPWGSLVHKIRTGQDLSYVYEHAEAQKAVTDLADCLTPTAYWEIDDPDAQLQDWEIKADICLNVYVKPCYFLVNPFYQNRWNQQHETLTLRFSFDKLKKLNGAAGVMLWAPRARRTDEYNQHLQYWANMGGYYNHMDCSWLRELNYVLGDPYFLSY